ncbi:MAG: hypothetical protein F6K11_00885 [Leptolyngbya sp. SIO3F4]|nr:hypothetical protein [Leptolyngbya sp. SIO3F4]
MREHEDMWACSSILIFKGYAVGEEKELKHYGDSLVRLKEIAEKHRQEEDKEAAPKRKKAEDLASKKIAITMYRNGLDFIKIPLFSIKNPRNGRQFKPFQYVSNDGSISVKINPNPDFGMADQMDANILRLVISKAREVKFITGYTPKSVQFTKYEILKALGRTDSSRDYKWLLAALNRLSSTHYSGNILNTVFGGTLIDYFCVRDGELINILIEMRAILRGYIDDNKSILAINYSIFQSRSNLQIRLYELVQSSIGCKLKWSISLAKLKNLCGSDRKLKNFKTDIINSKIPYRISFSKSNQQELIVTFERTALIENN